MDDVLASLVVFDAAGRIGTVTLPGADAAHAAFADLPFGPAALASARDLLNALVGTEFVVRGPRPMTGRLLRAETMTEPSGTQGGVPRTRVTLLTADGVQQFVLEDAESVQVADPALRGRIDRALAALRGGAAADLRRLTLRVPGAGRREVRVGYVAAAPLWKATYRLLLPAAEGKPARLQAWAVLENDTATDWDGVDLALQYGNPVTFRQALYRAYYVQRPEVPVEVLGRILPGVDTRALAAAAAAPAGTAAPAPMRMALAAPPPLAAPEPAPAPAEGAEATLFRLPAPVTLPAGQTATLPFLDREVPATRLGLVQEGRPHPLAAIRLANDTGASLPAGVLTLYDGADAAAFAGDARLGGLPPGETRLLAFAEDLRTAADWRIDAEQRLLGVTAAAGVLHLRERDRWTARITLVAPAAEPRHLLVEIPRRPGTLVVEGGARTGRGDRDRLAPRPRSARRRDAHAGRACRSHHRGADRADAGRAGAGAPARRTGARPGRARGVAARRRPARGGRLAPRGPAATASPPRRAGARRGPPAQEPRRRAGGRRAAREAGAEPRRRRGAARRRRDADRGRGSRGAGGRAGVAAGDTGATPVSAGQTGSQEIESPLRSSGMKLGRNAGSACSAICSGVQPSARWMLRIMRLWLNRIDLVHPHAEHLPGHVARRVGRRAYTASGAFLSGVICSSLASRAFCSGVCAGIEEVMRLHANGAMQLERTL